MADCVLNFKTYAAQHSAPQKRFDVNKSLLSGSGGKEMNEQNLLLNRITVSRRVRRNESIIIALPLGSQKVFYILKLKFLINEAGNDGSLLLSMRKLVSSANSLKI